MIEIRFHGRGGQGTVIASEILADAFAKEGNYVQVFPQFGVERRGAPVTAFLRINTKPINLRCKVYTPNHIIVLDPVLIDTVGVTHGLRQGGWVIINSHKSPEEFKNFSNFKVATVDASSIAIKYRLGPRTAPIVNTAILGAFVKVIGMVNLETVENAMKDYIPVDLEGNIKAAREAYKEVKMG
ncbi:2-oxoacid:acceptor oxidoreductase family protein [Candidatus Aminicenantes bacterium AH-873-B07]|nr:2-oxoacid:acceptor oxidoreductase family protein [Candidatus Aminicenantes bacterium AH-873-B07]